MDEQQALLVIQSALGLARDYYQTLLMDKISNSLDYQDECGYGYLMLALNNVFERIQAIENEENEVTMPTFTIDTDKAQDLDHICAALHDTAAFLSRDNLQIINDEFVEIANLSPIKPTSWTLQRLNELLDKANLLSFDNKTKTD